MNPALTVLTARCDDSGGLMLEGVDADGHEVSRTVRHFETCEGLDFDGCAFGPGAEDRCRFMLGEALIQKAKVAAVMFDAHAKDPADAVTLHASDCLKLGWEGTRFYVTRAPFAASELSELQRKGYRARACACTRR